MTLEEVMSQLESLGTDQTKSTFIRHGAREPFFGVRVGDLKKLVKHVKKEQNLVMELYRTGNCDAMYLAGLSANPRLMEKETLQEWAKGAYWYMLAEYTVSGVAAESRFALELAREWMQSPDEMIAVCGWSTYSHYLSITPDEELDLEEIRNMLVQVEENVHAERNRVKYAMNQFVICAGSFVPLLNEKAKETARKIGKVNVNVGNTACKVPLAEDYIQKVESKGKLGAKKKTSIC